MTTRSGSGGTTFAGGYATPGAGRLRLGEGITTFAGAGALTVDATVVSAPQAYAGSATFAGAGLLAASGTYLQIPGALSLVGAGSQTVNAKNYGQILATFSGAGTLATSAKHFVAGVYDETGSATASDTLGDVGKFTELEFGLQLDRANLVPGDVLEFRVYLDGVALDSYVTPSITVAASVWTATAAFAGTGSLSVSADITVVAGALLGSLALAGSGQASITAQLLASVRATLGGTGTLSATAQFFAPSAAAFAGAGNLSASSSLLLSAIATLGGAGSFSINTRQIVGVNALFSGAGSLFVDVINLAKAAEASALFAGVGSMPDIDASIYIPATSEFGGIGQMDVDGSRYIWLNEQFDGQGSLDVSTDHWLAALGVFGGEGLIAPIETSIISSREYWLICSGIGIQPEILGDAAMAATVAGSFELTTPLDGKPAMREC